MKYIHGGKNVVLWIFNQEMYTICCDSLRSALLQYAAVQGPDACL